MAEVRRVHPERTHMKLMPTTQRRKCTKCGFTWMTAFTHRTSCSNPSCGAMQLEVTNDWPHICAKGHAANHGGDCPTCEVTP